MLVLLAVFMLSEAVLSVERTGLPYLTIMVDDSASEAITDQYEKPEERRGLQSLADSALVTAGRVDSVGGSPADPATKGRPGWRSPRVCS